MPKVTNIKAARLQATAVESIARVVIAAFDEHIKIVDVEPEVKRTRGSAYAYTFGAYVCRGRRTRRGRYVKDVSVEITVTRKAGGVVATAQDENGDYYGPGTLTDVLEMIDFEHGSGSGKEIHWDG